MSALPYEYITYQERCRIIALLLRKGHFAAARAVWKDRPAPRKGYIIQAQVPQMTVSTIEDHLQFLEED